VTISRSDAKGQAESQREKLVERVRAAGLEHIEEAIVESTRSSVRIFTTQSDDETVTAAGATRFGGQPDLLPGTAWPTYDGVPMVFVLQLRLADVAPYDVAGELPPDGLLSFFVYGNYLSDAYGRAGKVVHVPEDRVAEVQRATLPPYERGSYEVDSLKPCACRFAVEVCIPPIEGPASDHLWKHEGDHEKYWDDVWEDSAFLTEKPFHRLLGHPDLNYNHHMERDNSVLLLQIDADDESGWEFGDCQAVRVLMPQDTLPARDFDRAWVNGDEE